MKSLIACFAALLLMTASLSAQSIQLRTGKILVGDVEIQDGGKVILIHVRYPKIHDLRLKPGQLTPRSLYSIYERRVDRKTAAGLRRLADLAKEAGLHGNAISDLLALKKITPKKAHGIDKEIQEIRESIAADLLGAARDNLAKENPHASLVYLHTLQELYPKTRAAKEARKMMTTAHERAGNRVDIAMKTVGLPQAPKVLSKIESYRANGDKARKATRNKRGVLLGGSKQRRALDIAIRDYRKAWEAARTLPVAVSEPQLRAKIAAARMATRKLLVEVLIDAATIQLARTSVSQAEEYCNEACSLDPKNQRLRDVHKTILEAKAIGF